MYACDKDEHQWNFQFVGVSFSEEIIKKKKKQDLQIVKNKMSIGHIEKYVKNVEIEIEYSEWKADQPFSTIDFRNSVAFNARTHMCVTQFGPFL